MEMWEYQSRLKDADRRVQLCALRDFLIESILTASHGYRAALAKQLADVLRDIDALPNSEYVDDLGELGARRNARRADAALPDGAGLGDVGG
jgi:hypothetical protein